MKLEDLLLKISPAQFVEIYMRNNLMYKGFMDNMYEINTENKEVVELWSDVNGCIKIYIL